jgi:hypothetical protein
VSKTSEGKTMNLESPGGKEGERTSGGKVLGMGWKIPRLEERVEGKQLG